MSVDLEDFAWLKAGILARERWPEITTRTQLYIANHDPMVIPVYPDPGKVIIIEDGIVPMDRVFGQEEITLDTVGNLYPVKKLGYGQRTDTLVIMLYPEE